MFNRPLVSATRKPFYYLLILLLLVSCHQQRANGENNVLADPSAEAGQRNDQQIVTVANWNIEWLGSTSNGPRNKSRQLQNASKILQYLDADLYCLCEIVDPESLKQLSNDLGPDYRYQIAPYASGASSTRDPGYKTAQKLAYIYNTRVFKEVRTRAFLKDDPRAGYNFASGRYPYELEATIHTPHGDQRVHFMIIHAKAGAERTSYQRRLAAANTLKAALDQTRRQQAVMLLGDFNDHIPGSITQGQPSPYNSFLEDPNYHVLTGPLSDQSSTLDYPGVIDHQIISASLNRFYLTGSTKIRTDITSVVKDYKSGNTSDHYPVTSSFDFSKENLAADAKKAPAIAPAIKPEPLKQRIFTAKIGKGNIHVRAARKSTSIQFIVYNKNQHKVLSVHRKYILKGDSFRISTPVLYKGDYTLVIFSNHGKQVIPFSVK